MVRSNVDRLRRRNGGAYLGHETHPEPLAQCISSERPRDVTFCTLFRLTGRTGGESTSQNTSSGSAFFHEECHRRAVRRSTAYCTSAHEPSGRLLPSPPAGAQGIRDDQPEGAADSLGRADAAAGLHSAQAAVCPTKRRRGGPRGGGAQIADVVTASAGWVAQFCARPLPSRSRRPRDLRRPPRCRHLQFARWARGWNNTDSHAV